MANTKSIFVSFIVPHKNSFKDLFRCINSIPDKDDFELIVVDDNSDFQLDKKTLFSLKERTRIKLICQKVGRGAGFCRNVGINNSSGKWIVFADADDYFLNSFNEIICRLSDTPYDLHYFKVDSRYSLTGEISDRHLMWNEMLTFENENDLRFKHVVPWGKIIRRDIIKENSILFDEIMYSNDITFSTKVGYFSKKIKIHDLSCYCVTKQQGTLFSNVSASAIYSRLFANYNRNVFLCQVNRVSYQVKLTGYFKIIVKTGNLKYSCLALYFVIRDLFNRRACK